jgi:hypothetical protein
VSPYDSDRLVTRTVLPGVFNDVLDRGQSNQNDDREHPAVQGRMRASGSVGDREPSESPVFSSSDQGGLRELFGRAFEFRLSDLLRLRTFLYLLPLTGIFLVQIYNTIAIQKLALANETLREQIAMSSSVVTSQELKVNELQGIHNIALQAELLGLQASREPAVEIVP